MNFFGKIKKLMNEWVELLLVAGHSEQYRKALGITKGDLQKLMDGRKSQKPISVIKAEGEEFLISVGAILLESRYFTGRQFFITVQCLTNSMLNARDRNGMNFINNSQLHRKITDALKRHRWSFRYFDDKAMNLKQ